MANTERESLHIFWTTEGISIKFSEKDVTYENIKSHTQPGFHPLLRRYLFEKNTDKREGGRREVKLRLRLGLKGINFL